MKFETKCDKKIESPKHHVDQRRFEKSQSGSDLEDEDDELKAPDDLDNNSAPEQEL